MTSPQRSGPGIPLVAVLVLLSFVGPLATDMYLPAFPVMAHEFGTDAAGVQLTLTSMMAGLALGQLLFGPLSDRHGRRALLLAGAAISTVTTALCALAPSLEWLIALRFVQGFSVAAGIVIGRAIVSDVARGPVAQRLFGILMTLTSTAPIVAPLAGAAAIGAGGWRWVYWTLAVVFLAMFLGVLLAVPESLSAERRHTGGAAATLRAMRLVLADRPYLGYALAFTFTFGSLFCYIAASPFLLQNILGLTVGQASIAFAAGGLIVTLSSAVNSVLVARIAAARLLTIGLIGVLVAASVLLAVTVAGRLGTAIVLTLVALAFVSMGLVFSNSAALAIARVPYAAGSGSAVLGTLQNVLAALVAPLVGLGGEHTAVPMAAGMAAISALAVLALLLTRGRQALGDHERTTGQPTHA